MAQCSIESCTRDANGGNGWCRAHYMRWYQTGDVRATVPLRPRGGDPQLRFWPKVDKNGPIPDHRPELGPCWVYGGNSDRRGYGHFKVNGKELMAHRFAFLLEDEIPDGLELDHLCRNTSCVRRSHLEPVTHLVNMQRAYPERSHCPQGHEFTEANTFYTKTGRQRCRACAKRNQSEHLERREQAADAPCAVEDCSNQRRTRMMCSMHYARWLRHGDAGFRARVPSGTWRGEQCQVETCNNPARALGYCNRHYAKFRSDGDPLAPDHMAPRGLPLPDRIKARSQSDGDCLIWSGPTDSNGYGRINIQGRGVPVHRASYEAFIGPIPTGRSVAQSCGKHNCVNPEHLVLGSKPARGRST